MSNTTIHIYCKRCGNLYVSDNLPEYPFTEYNGSDPMTKCMVDAHLARCASSTPRDIVAQLNATTANLANLAKLHHQLHPGR